MATVIEGDFEWDEEKARSNLEKHGVPSPKRPPFSLTRLPCTLTTVPGQTGWWSLEPPCATVSCTLCMSNAGDVTASSPPDLHRVSNETFTNPEVVHDSTC